MKEYTGRVTEYRYDTDDVIFMSLEFSPTDFTFKAGQFVTILIKSGDIQRMKSYSILNAPNESNTLNFGIKLIPQGFASEVFRKTKVGDTFTFKGPFGNFMFRDNEEIQEHIFIGTGTGVTPLFSMIHENVTKLSNKKFKLICGYRYKKNILYEEDLKKLAETNPNFSYEIILSQEKDWQGPKGRVQSLLNARFEHKKFYICGLKEMVLETRNKLLESGVSKSNIDYERYS